MTGKPTFFETGPFTGMRYTRWDGLLENTSDVAFAFDMMLDASGPRSAYRGRPGRYRINSSTLGSVTYGQLVYQYTKVSGTQATVIVANGEIYTLNWSTGVYTKMVSTANLTTATVTVSGTARCYAVTLNDKMVISDGVNTPFTWDGSSGAGGIVKLTAAPVFYGQMTVYYAKLFGIKNTERSTVVWSNENDPTTGYESGYNNAWTLSQTGSDPLYAIRATNEALYYWRQRSIGAIRGQVDDNFTNSGVVDAVSTLVGTRSPAGVCIYNDTAYFPDEYGRPCAFRAGGGVEPLWEQIALAYPQDSTDNQYETTIALSGYAKPDQTEAQLFQYVTVPWRGGNKIIFAWTTGNTVVDRGSVFSAASGKAESFWNLSGGGSGALLFGEVINGVTGLPELLFIDTDGFTYGLGKYNTQVDSTAAGGTQAIDARLIGPRHGATDVLQYIFTRLDLVVDAKSGSNSTGTAGIVTNREPNATGQSYSVTSSFALEQVRAALGLARHGRWAQVVMTGPAIGSTGVGAVHGWTLTAVPQQVTPGTR